MRQRWAVQMNDGYVGKPMTKRQAKRAARYMNRYPFGDTERFFPVKAVRIK